jgi:hypothetical protein
MDNSMTHDASATAATAPQPSAQPWLQTPPRNHRATIAFVKSATMLQPLKNKAQPPRNHPKCCKRNRATIPYREGETVAPSRAHPVSLALTPDCAPPLAALAGAIATTE